MKEIDISRKRKLIPDEWKENIDEIIRVELVEANRYFAKVNPFISQKVEEISQLPPDLFIIELKQRWDWHHRFYEDLLEPILPFLTPKDHLELSPANVQLLIKSYEVSSLVDQATLITSAAIKKNIQNWLATRRQSLSIEERSVLLTPPTETFWAQYTIDHIRYILAKKKNIQNAQNLYIYLLNKYHLGDESIFRGRFRQFKRYENYSEQELVSIIDRLTIERDYKIKHFYTILERPDLKAITELLIYDNYDEPWIVYNLVGISGFILRKKILEYLNNSDVLPNNGKIYSLSDQEVMQALELLENLRKKNMIRHITPYRQRKDTCVSCSLMMILHYLDNSFKLNKRTEMSLHSRIRVGYIEGEYLSAAAYVAKKLGYETILIHSENFFKEGGLIKGRLFDLLLNEYKKFLIPEIVVMNNVDINPQLIKHYLEEDYLIIVAGQLGENVLHAIVAHGYDGDEYIIVTDPLSGKMSKVKYEHLFSFMNTSIGKWMLCIGRDRKTIESFLRDLSNFKSQALVYLKT